MRLPGIISEKEHHRCHFSKEFDNGAQTDFYFIQNGYYDDSDSTSVEADTEVKDSDTVHDLVTGDVTLHELASSRAWTLLTAVDRRASNDSHRFTQF